MNGWQCFYVKKIYACFNIAKCASKDPYCAESYHKCAFEDFGRFVYLFLPYKTTDRYYQSEPVWKYKHKSHANNAITKPVIEHP